MRAKPTVCVSISVRIAALVAAFVLGTNTRARAIEVSVSTDQPAYVVGDPVLYTVTATNPSSSPVTLNWGSSHQADFVVDGVYSPPDFGLGIITDRVVPAGGSIDWTFLHSWPDYALTPGGHSVIGEVVNYGFSNEVATFSVAAPDPVTDDVFLDFEAYPNGVSTTDGNRLSYGFWEQAFAREGVRFSSEGGSVNLKQHFDQGVVLHTPTSSYPPGFNIVAEFDMPVYGVSADVGTANGRSVTMYAYDAAGELLGSVASDPITTYPVLEASLSFSSETPIASVQWFSSEQQVSVQVDNLSLNIDDAEEQGDFNGDGLVDAADYSVWRDNLDRVVAPGWGADADQNGVIDAGDYAVWWSHYGVLGAEAGASVPEPTGLGLLVSCGLLAGVARRLG